MPPTPVSANQTVGTSNRRAVQASLRHKLPQKKHKSPEEKLRKLFSSLCAQLDGGHFKNGLKTCDKILNIKPMDEDALQTKLFLLLQTDQYDAAFDQLSGASESNARQFEKAYVLYRKHQESDAVTILSGLSLTDNSPEANRGILHLDAQLKYRQGAYQDALDICTQLLDTAVQSEEHSDLLTNLGAAQMHLDFLTTGYLQALDALPSSVSNTLESAPPPAPPVPSLVSAVKRSEPPSSQKSAVNNGNAVKVRMSRVPKGVIPGVTPPPDPERWIKKSERTNLVYSGKRRRPLGGGATQGSTAELSAGSHNPKSSATKHKKKK